MSCHVCCLYTSAHTHIRNKLAEGVFKNMMKMTGNRRTKGHYVTEYILPGLQPRRQKPTLSTEEKLIIPVRLSRRKEGKLFFTA